MANIAIYTCITGDYEIPTDNFPHKDGYGYILFSDKPISTKSWTNLIIEHHKEGLSAVKRQRHVKTHPHVVLPDYDIAVWVDANTSIDDKLYRYIEANKDIPITFKEHPGRNCIYEEMKAVVMFRKETKEMVNQLRERYEKEGFPHGIGLYETGIIVSHPKDERVRLLFDMWWKEIYHNSHRDQLSVNYVIWKYHLESLVHSVATKDFPARRHIKPNASFKNGTGLVSLRQRRRF